MKLVYKNIIILLGQGVYLSSERTNQARRHTGGRHTGTVQCWLSLLVLLTFCYRLGCVRFITLLMTSGPGTRLLGQFA